MFAQRFAQPSPLFATEDKLCMTFMLPNERRSPTIMNNLEKATQGTEGRHSDSGGVPLGPSSRHERLLKG